MGLVIYSLLQQVTALRLQDGFGFTVRASIARAGMIMMLTMAVMILIQGAVVRRLNLTPRRLILGGAGISLCALLIALFAPSPFWLLAGTLGLGAGLGMLLPGNLAALSLRAGAQHQGRAAGLNGFAQGLGTALGPLGGAVLNQVSPRLPYALSLLLMGLITLVALRGLSPEPTNSLSRFVANHSRYDR